MTDQWLASAQDRMAKGWRWELQKVRSDAQEVAQGGSLMQGEGGDPAAALATLANGIEALARYSLAHLDHHASEGQPHTH
jgi:hypothetical protein